MGDSGARGDDCDGSRNLVLFDHLLHGGGDLPVMLVSMKQEWEEKQQGAEHSM